MVEKGEMLSKHEIENRLIKMGDYVKIDFLTSCLKQSLDFDTKKFVLNRLSALYETRGLYAEAAKLMTHSADINTTFTSKMNDFQKSAQLYVTSGDYVNADIAFGKAMACGNDSQKVDLKKKRKQYYIANADSLIKMDKRKSAMLACEKLLTLDLDPLEKKHIQNNLLKLYEQLGKVREFFALKNSLDKQ